MTTRLSRRTALAGLAALHPAAAGAAQPDPGFAAIEARLGGRLGVFVLDTGSGAHVGHRADERFPTCSTFKLALAAAVLQRIDQGREQLTRMIAYGPADLLSYAPVAKARLAEGALSVEDLCAAAAEVSDNTAANLLLASLGGPAGLTRWFRSIGDGVTRIDRTETSLNSSIPGDPRDTTTPRAMVADLGKILLGEVLTPASRARFVGWAVNSKRGLKRLRAGLPTGWRVGDKTGTWDGPHASCNDIAIAWPPGRSPLLIAAYATAITAPPETHDAAMAEVGRLAATWATRSA